MDLLWFMISEELAHNCMVTCSWAERQDKGNVSERCLLHDGSENRGRRHTERYQGSEKNITFKYINPVTSFLHLGITCFLKIIF